jgi:hypothetical protein
VRDRYSLTMSDSERDKRRRALLRETERERALNRKTVKALSSRKDGSQFLFLYLIMRWMGEISGRGLVAFLNIIGPPSVFCSMIGP